MPKTPDDWMKAPKTYAEDFSMAFKDDMFFLSIRSGNQEIVYSITPAHMKRVMQLLTYNIDQYREKHGEIQGPDWTPHIQSPIQMKKNPPENK